MSVENYIGKELWRPSDALISNSELTRFARSAEQKSGLKFNDFSALHKWSTTDLEGFWSLVWDDLEIEGKKGSSATSLKMPMPGAKFFPDSKLNFAENLLRKKGKQDALIFLAEDKHRTRLSWDDLHNKVSQTQQYFIENGIGVGDRIVAMLPNMPEAIIGMLAASSLGAIWSSCSPDFGEKGVLDRFGQIEPKIFISCDGYWYNGKEQNTVEKTLKIAANLPSIKKI